MTLLRNALSRSVLLLGAGLLAGSASANDSTATLGAGGLELTPSAEIVMEDEKLFLSPQEVRVRYVFRNEADRDVATRVAFPLPVVSFGPDDNFALPDFEAENFVGFSVVVDGQPVVPALEQRALLDDGTDVTAAVEKAGLPVNANLPSWGETIEALPRDARERLVKQGVLEQLSDTVDDAADLAPSWSLHATYHWEQTFPAGEPVMVEHRYQPVVGSSFFVGDKGDTALLSEEYGQQYCLDSAGKAGLRRLLQRAAKANAHGDTKLFLLADEVRYVLTTGANWKGPIGRFELTIDKLKPDAILSLCTTGIRKTGPTTFTVEREDFTPTEDVGLVVFHLEERGG